MDTGTWHAQLARGHWFSHLPPDLQRSLLGAARLRVLTAGQYLFKRGDPPCGVYAVLEGTVRISAVSAQGKEAVLSLVETPYWFGEICLFDNLPRTHDAMATGACRLLQVPQVPQAAMLGILEQHPLPETLGVRVSRSDWVAIKAARAIRRHVPAPDRSGCLGCIRAGTVRVPPASWPPSRLPRAWLGQALQKPP